MKRILPSIVVLLILFSSISCFAAEYEETRTGNVYAKVSYPSNSGMYTAISNNGKYVIITDDNIQITVYSNNSDLVLVVHQIMMNEKKSYEWFESCIPKSVICFIPYDIYFLNASRERIELSSENKITISISKSTQYVLGLSCEGNIIDMPYLIKDGNIIFTTTVSSDYYLLCEKQNNIKSPETGNIYDTHLLSNIELVILIYLVLCSKKYVCSKKDKESRIS